MKRRLSRNRPMKSQLSRNGPKAKKAETMLRNIAIIMAFLWVIALFTSFTLDGWIHVLIAGAVALLVVNAMRSENGRVGS